MFLENYALSLSVFFKEAYAHAEFYLKRPLNEMEKLKIYKQLVYRDEHYYHKTEKNSQLCLVMYSFIPLRKCKTITNGDW